MSKPLIEVVAGIIWSDGKYLAVERPEGVKMAGWWEFPGGKIEPGESGGEAVVRELQEELAITPTKFEFWRELLHEYEEFVVKLQFFNIYKYSGTLSPLESQQMTWVDPLRPPTLDYLPADIKIVEILHK